MIPIEHFVGKIIYALFSLNSFSDKNLVEFLFYLILKSNKASPATNKF